MSQLKTLVFCFIAILGLNAPISRQLNACTSIHQFFENEEMNKKAMTMKVPMNNANQQSISQLI